MCSSKHGRRRGKKVPCQATRRRLASGEPLERRDCPATVGIVGPATVAEGDSGFVSAVYNVSLSAPLAKAATVAYSVVGGTASAAKDFSVPAGLAGRLTFAAGQTSQTLTVRVHGDTLREAAETFSVRLASPVNCTLATAIASTSIIDNDSYTLSIVAPTTTFVEGKAATVAIKLSAPATRNEQVVFRTINGTARSGLDFGLVAGNLVTFAPGQDTQIITVPTFADGVAEGAEYFTLAVKPLDARVGSEVQATVFLDDGSTPGPLPSLVAVAATTPSATEIGPSAGVLRFTRVGSTATALAVNYIVSGTASPGADYGSLPGVATFAAGASFVDVPVLPVDDAYVETSEDVRVVLQAGAGYVVGSAASATVTIVSDDITPPNPPDPPKSERGFQVTFKLPADLPADTVRMFTEAGKQWTAIVDGDVVDVRDSLGNLLVDDFELVVTFRSGPRDVTDPRYIPWQQPEFGGARYTERRPGSPGLPYRGEAEITLNALKPEFFQKMKPEYDKFSTYKTMELIGRALGFDSRLMLERGLVQNIRYPQLGVNNFIPVIRRGTNAAAKFAGKISEVPLNAETWTGIAHWSSDFTRFGGLASFGFDVFVVGWQNQSSVNGETRPKISNVTRGLFADLGYPVRYS